MRQYRPRRASKRWLDGDCPKEVLAIFDDPNFADRYTVFYTEVILDGSGFPWIGYRSMSEAPSHPQGVGLYSEMRAHDVQAYRYRMSHKACTWSSLPDAVKALVRSDAKEIADFRLTQKKAAG